MFLIQVALLILLFSWFKKICPRNVENNSFFQIKVVKYLRLLNPNLYFFLFMFILDIAAGYLDIVTEYI